MTRDTIDRITAALRRRQVLVDGSPYREGYNAGLRDAEKVARRLSTTPRRVRRVRVTK